MFSWFRAIPGQAQGKGKGAVSRHMGGGWCPSWSQSTRTVAASPCASSWCKPALSASLCPGSTRLPSAWSLDLQAVSLKVAWLSPRKRGSPAGRAAVWASPHWASRASGQHGRKGTCSQERGCDVSGTEMMTSVRSVWPWDTLLSQPELIGWRYLSVGADERWCPETSAVGKKACNSKRQQLKHRAPIIKVNSWKAVRVSEGTGPELELLWS